MLNISNYNLKNEIPRSKYATLKEVERKMSGHTLRRLLYITLLVCVIVLLLPWTQNIKTFGNVTTLTPNQKPQSITTVIGGQIEKWYVKEGDFVRKGDTILKITEIKDAYFDTELLPRTKNQVALKKQSITTYENKIKNQNEQLLILKKQRDLKLNQSKIKLEQAKLKLQNDSIAYQAALMNLKIANYQLKRTDSLFAMGLKSLTDLEAKKMKQQQVASYKIKAENKWLNSQSGLLNLQIEISNVEVKFKADYNKIQSTQLSTVNQKIDAESGLNKLENQYSNYEIRTNLYYILAQQNGYVTKTNIGGVGETIKAGQVVFTLMPEKYDLAVEIYISPVDLPLVKKGEHVRLQFDGWPSIVFSGWPGLGHGTFGGEVYAIDQYISPNGKYRLLVKQGDEYSWPEALRFGSGASAMLLLNDVPIWYELWRNINGFPPDFYKGKEIVNNKKK